MKRPDIYALIDAERERQLAKWGGDHAWGSGDCSSWDVHPAVKIAVLAEECGEAAQAMLDQNHEALQSELVQVAAVAVAFLEAMEVL